MATELSPFDPDTLDTLIYEHGQQRFSDGQNDKYNSSDTSIAAREAAVAYATKAVETRDARIGKLEDRIMDLESRLEPEPEVEHRG